MKPFFKKIGILLNPEILQHIHLVILNRMRKRSNAAKFQKSIINRQDIKKKVILFSDSSKGLIDSADREILQSINNNSNGYLDGKFNLLSAKFSFNHKINWLYDPIDNRDWDERKFDERDVTYPGSPKDVKIVWELNRHQYLFTLSKNYLITRDDKYADCVTNHILSWIEQNPVDRGINWASSMEVSIRLLSWILSLDILREHSSFVNSEKIIMDSVYEHIQFLNYHLSEDRLLHTNHLIGELTGLIIACMVYEFKDSDKIMQRTLPKLSKELKDQVFPDGVSKEQSTSYHRFVIDFLTLIVVAADRSKVRVPPSIRSILEKMIIYVNAVIMPDGSSPMIGDADNGRGFLISEQSNFWNFGHVLANGAIIFKNGLFKNNSAVEEESFWLFGNEGKIIYESLDMETKGLEVYKFSESGHYIVKDITEGFYFFVRGGKFGMGGNYFSSHSHFDLLSPVVCIKGAPIFLDTGTYVYNGDPENRNRFRISQAHNNITWSSPLAIPKLNFGWKKVCDALLIEDSKNDSSIKLVFGLKKVRKYKREFILKTNSVVINDYFYDSFDNLQWNFHLHPDCRIEESSKDYVVINNGDIKVIFRASYPGLKVAVSETSFNYGEKIKNLRLSLDKSVVKSEVVSFTLSEF